MFTEKKRIGIREISGSPSTDRIKIMRERYLSSPLMIDVEYIRYYT